VVRAGLCVALVLLALPLASCNIVGAGYVLLHGPPTIPPEYTLDKTRTTALLIDDRSGVLPRRILTQQIAQSVESALLDKKLVDDLISSRATRMIASQEQHDKPISLQQIARGVGADVLIDVTIDAFSLSPDGQTFAPTSTARVKVFDAETGERLWPEQREGFTRTIRMPTQQGSAPTSRTELLEAQRTLASWTGIGVAQLFYKRERTDDKGRG